MQAFIIPFLAIAAAELFDKSQLSLLILATRTKNHFQLLLGSLLGFAIVDGLAVLVGAWITTVIPTSILSPIAGIIFIVVGILTFRSAKEKPKDKKIAKSSLLAGFLVIMLTEWGDKTQLATAVFATQFNPWLVFAGVMSALFLLSLVAIYLGKYLGMRFNPKTIHRVAGAAFILIGLSFIFFRNLPL
jgi:putative Ca2+/H+ antiporter (TMEM165/GDT1 family)